MGMLLQFLASLAAVLALAWVAHRFGLGTDRRIASEDEARELADEAICGFEPRELVVDRDGQAALLRDDAGRILLLRRHGAHFASRLLDATTDARLDNTRLTLGTSDRWFGHVTLDLGAAAPEWAARLGARS